MPDDIIKDFLVQVLSGWFERNFKNHPIAELVLGWRPNVGIWKELVGGSWYPSSCSKDKTDARDICDLNTTKKLDSFQCTGVR